MPASFCALVPANTSRIESARSATVNRSDANGAKILLRRAATGLLVGKLNGFEELVKRWQLLFNRGRRTEELEIPHARSIDHDRDTQALRSTGKIKNLRL